MQINKFYGKIVLLIILAMVFTSSCDNSADFEENGPGKQESRRVLVDVNVIAYADKTTFEALFYYDITGMVDGKEVSGVDKEVIKVIDAKLGEIELKEETNSNGKIVYTAEISNELEDYELTFSPNESMQTKHKLKIEPIYIKEKNLRLERSKIHEVELSREVTKGELPAVVEIKNHTKEFMPANIDYLSQKLFFREEALDPFPIGKTTLKVRFESNPNVRDGNKSVRFLNYMIEREIEIVK